MEIKPMVVGLTGPAGVGKDTVADLILKNFKRFEKKSFAAPLKRMCRAGLGLTLSQTDGDLKEVVDPRYGCTPRHIMQTLGKEWGRDLIHPNIWVIAMQQHLGPFTIISDVRFENEAAFVRKHGVLIHLVGRGGLDGVASEHASESGVYKQQTDYTLDNTGTLRELENAVVAMIDILAEDGGNE